MSTIFRPPILFFLLSAFLLSNCKKEEEKKKEIIEKPTPVIVEHVQRKTMIDALLSTNTVASRTTLDLVAEVPGVITKLWGDQGDPVKKNRKLAKIQREEIKLSLNVASTNTTQLKREVQRLRPLLEKGIISQQIFDNAVYKLEQARAELKRAKNAFGDTLVRSRINGVIASRFVHLGQQVATGTPLFRIVDPDDLIVNIQLPERALSNGLLGRKANIESDAVGIKTTGIVEKVSPTVDARTGTVQVRIALKDEKANTKTHFIPGMFVRVNIVLREKKDVLRVPRRALIYNDNSVSVFTVPLADSPPQLATRKNIKIGLLDSTHAEVIEGLSENDRIVVIGQDTLKDGAKVEIESSKNPSQAQ